jgi:hypothetical protein
MSDLEGVMMFGILLITIFGFERFVAWPLLKQARQKMQDGSALQDGAKADTKWQVLTGAKDVFRAV